MAVSIEYIKGFFGQLSTVQETSIENNMNFDFDILGRKNNVPFNKLVIKKRPTNK